MTWKEEFDIANRWRACLEANKKRSLDLLEGKTGHRALRAVPKEERPGIVKQIEVEVSK